MPNTKPVIFLAFANDRQDDRRYLRNLPEELRSVTERLDKAVKAGLCELVVKTNTTVNELLDVFQENRGRIALFHFGGHAGGFQLLMETVEGNPAFAHAAGFAEFLGQQQGLQLVFLNGCSTEPQVEGLLAAGIPAVVATSQAIEDEIATELSTRFYNALAGGASIRTAFAESVAAVKVAAVKTVKGEEHPGKDRGNTRSTRDFVSLSEDEQPDRWPWELYISEGADVVEAWSLPKAAGDPLFGLPQLPEQDLPESPYRNLQWFQEDHAAIFFGRGREIADLYHFVTDRLAKPIVLFYGQSGVGKSSVLHAGLMPRLKATHDVRYVRRNREQGLTGTLAGALGIEAEQDLTDAWHALEEEKPLVVILDQVEELYTRPGKSDEMELFLVVLERLFANRSTRPAGKLILGFRKEWLADIDDQLKKQNLPRSEFFLKRLDREGIVEIVRGPTRDEAMRSEYKLTVEDTLSEIIADDLLEDRDAPVATTLSILLTKMWIQARKQSREAPMFTIERYQQLKREGLLLDDFLDEQLEALKIDAPDERWKTDVVESGLAIDVLAFHTTPLGTAESRTKEELERVYSHRKTDLQELIRRCEDLYLLVRVTGLDEANEQKTTTRLAHDTLAPLVRQRLKDSDAPGQRAQRILEQNVREWKAGKKNNPLRKADLNTLKDGELGMHARDDDEKDMVAASRKAYIRSMAMMSFAGFAVLMISGFVYWYVNKYDDCDGRPDAPWCIACLDSGGRYDVEQETTDLYCIAGSFQGLDLEDDFVRVNPGTFTMGSDSEGADSDEQPVHEVTISQAYYLGKTEVTQAQWYAVMGKNPSSFKDPDKPVESVSWNDTQDFLQKLNEIEGCEDCYRLPTEAEWEYAARTGTRTAYSFGDDVSHLGDYAWFEDNAETTTHPVGEKGANPWGLYDMHGNVWEWVQDWYDDYPDSSLTDPTGPESGSRRVVRGGSWIYDARGQRSANRGSIDPGVRDINFGFRVVRTYP